MAGTGVAARRGILIKDAEALELAHAHRRGGLRQDRHADRRPAGAGGSVGGRRRHGTLARGCRAAGGQQHPLARAVLQAWHRPRQAVPAVASPARPSRPGCGRHAGRRCGTDRLGSLRWMQERVPTWPLAAQAAALQAQGHTVSAVAVRCTAPPPGAPTAGPAGLCRHRQAHRGGGRARLASHGRALGAGDGRQRRQRGGRGCRRWASTEMRAEVLPADKAAFVAELKAGLNGGPCGDGGRRHQRRPGAGRGRRGHGHRAHGRHRHRRGHACRRHHADAGRPGAWWPRPSTSAPHHAKIRQNLFWAFATTPWACRWRPGPAEPGGGRRGHGHEQRQRGQQCAAAA
jgi:Cu+-exporting ATPase